MDPIHRIALTLHIDQVGKNVKKFLVPLATAIVSLTAHSADHGNKVQPTGNYESVYREVEPLVMALVEAVDVQKASNRLSLGHGSHRSHRSHSSHRSGR